MVICGKRHSNVIVRLVVIITYIHICRPDMSSQLTPESAINSKRHYTNIGIMYNIEYVLEVFTLPLLRSDEVRLSSVFFFYVYYIISRNRHYDSLE